MSEKLQARAETLKLARLLGRDPQNLGFLAEVPVADLVALREQVTDVLFNAHDGVLTRLVAASRLLPTAVVAAIGERAFGPMLSARVAGRLDPDRAVEMAGRLPTAFLADVAVEIDPRRASDLLARIPPRRVADITGELVRRGEYVTMGRFMGHLSSDATIAAVAAMDDGALLQVAFVLESKSSMAQLVDLLARERIEAILAAAGREDLWAEVLDLVSHLTLNQQRRFAALPAVSEPQALERIATVAREQELWPQLLPLVPYLPEPALATLGGILAGLDLDDGELDALRAAAEDPGLRPGLERLASAGGLGERRH